MKAQRRRAAAMVLGTLAVGATTACASVARSKDYSFALTCLVVDQSGDPVSGAEVVLNLGSVAYEAISPTQQVRKITPASGGLVFMYITHTASTPYVLTVKRSGYLDSQVRGEHRAEEGGTHLKITLVSAAARVSGA